MINIITSKNLTFPHGFSTRTGGVSTGMFESLNLGMNRGDDDKLVKENWDRFLRACNMDPDNMYDKNSIPFVCGAQVHGNVVRIVTKKDARIAYEKYSQDYINDLIDRNVNLSPDNLIEADGYVTNEINLPLAIFTADCTPLLMEDPVNKVIAAVHCGWRSTAKDIMKNAIDAMLSLGADINEIRAAIGPAICKDCFEVGEEVIDAMKELLTKDTDNKDFLLISSLYRTNPANTEKYLLDLKAVVRQRLIQIGLKEENINDVNECTMCQPKKYWSHRIVAAKRGSQANVIMINN